MIDWLKAIQVIPPDGKSVTFDFKEDYDTIFAKVAEQIDNYQPPAIVEQEEPAAPSVPVLREKLSEKIAIETTPAIAIDIQRLPVTGAKLFGRQKDLEILDNAWEAGGENVISFVAGGGTGKSTLVNKWIERMAADNCLSAKRVYAWSFYSQGTGERVTSADQFISHALKFLGDADPTQGSAWDKGKRLAGLIRSKKTLLILDGMEPLQSDLGFEYGKIKDPALSVLVSELVKGNHGLCVITSRLAIPDMLRYPSSVRQVDLEQISDEAGRALLRVRSVQSSDAELEGVTRGLLATMPWQLKPIKLRVIKLVNATGEVSVLLTNLLNTERYPQADFRSLYFRRYEVESYYRDEKVSIEIEKFYSKNYNSIMQELFAVAIMGVIARFPM